MCGVFKFALRQIDEKKKKNNNKKTKSQVFQ